MKIEIRKNPCEAGDITIFRLINNQGNYVELSSLGAGILAVGVPDRFGRIDNIALGYADPAAYMSDGPCMGKTPGRYANRIAGGKLEIDGELCQLAVNNGPNHLHGGPTGFQNRLWDTEILPDGVRFTYRSADGEENYPGNLTARVEYRWTNRNQLEITYTATTDATTVVNLTNHTYWNLEGADSGCALGHRLRINASRWLPTDPTLVPTGEIASVEGTPMDFRRPHPIGERIRDNHNALCFGKGYDNCWVLDGDGEAVVLTAPSSGRTLTVETDQPGVQVYSGNWLAGAPINRSGRRYLDYDGIAIEAQGLPDAPNKPGFPQQTLRPVETYRRYIRFTFS